MSRAWQIMSLLSLMGFSSNAWSYTSNETMKEVTDFAARNCQHVRQEGAATTLEVKLGIKAGLVKIFKKLIDAGASGSAEVDAEKYSGVVRDQLRLALKDENECKANIVKLFNPLISKSVACMAVKMSNNHFDHVGTAVKINGCINLDATDNVITNSNEGFVITK